MKSILIKKPKTISTCFNHCRVRFLNENFNLFASIPTANWWGRRYVRGVRYLPITIAARSGAEAQNARLLSQRHYSFRKSIRQRFFELEKK